MTMTGGRATTTGCGLWVRLAPLESGFHVLEISGRSGEFTTRVDYTLAVETAND
ncbi:hypothetical protein [Streptomyces sp. NPDC026673]|uniref:hypothetical protein n=1 Tax=Streptomyces sp. NPDC026673 TaxID=3155724 RepID=UPI0033F8EDD6